MPTTTQQADEAFVLSIRRGVNAFSKWKSSMTAVVVMFFLIAAFAFLFVIVNQVRTNPFAGMSPGAAYFAGMVHGTSVGLLIYSIIYVVFQFYVVANSWRLLLAYHDRLEQAGLLPLEPAATIETRDPEQTRS